MTELNEQDLRDVESMLGAVKAGVHGWNLICNVCGKFGARWRYYARTETGGLAACEGCGSAIKAEIERHELEMRKLTEVKFRNQPSDRAQDYAFQKSVKR